MKLLFRRKPLPPPPQPECAPLDLEALAPPPPDSHRRGPLLAAPLLRAMRTLDGLFDWAYSSRYNPLYRSGTLATGLLLVVIATGLYLLLYYRLGAPYESLQRLQAQAWAGRWIRALHRYASDAALLATLFHFLRMAAEGKSWGPRLLAWISGLLLLGAFALAAYTGFVMVWDQQGLRLAQAGARVADLLPLFAEPISRAFSGASAAPSSFFFMNLFLHVAIPLAMTAMLWVHTSRLARSQWLPKRRELYWLVGGLLGLSLAFPAALGIKADPLELGGAYPADWLFSFWLPLAAAWPPQALAALAAAAAALGLSAPWTWRPSRALEHPPSVNDPSRCEGCVQCVWDCPFEAISMVPRSAGQGSAMVAQVDPALCTSCGLCVGSCDRLSVGPPDRSGHGQMARAQALGREGAKDKLVFLYCANNPSWERVLAAAQGRQGLKLVPFALDCVGDAHPFAVHALLNHFAGVYLYGCPPSACLNREGWELARMRMFEGREPSAKVSLDKGRIMLGWASKAEVVEGVEDVLDFAASLGLLAVGEARRPRPRWKRLARGAALSLPLLSALGWQSNWRTGSPVPDAALNLTWRLEGQQVKECRQLSEAELKARPAHMRRKEECKVRRLSYQLEASVDGQPRLSRSVHPRGARGDAPLNVQEALALSPGRHKLRVSFLPLDDSQGKALKLVFEREVEARAGRALLLTHAPSAAELELLEKAR